MIQNGGRIRGSAVEIDALEDFTPLDDKQWQEVWTDDPTIASDRSRQFHIGESVGVGVVLDYHSGPEPRILLLHYNLGQELRDHGFTSFEELLNTAIVDEADSNAHEVQAPAPAPPSSLWITSVGPNIGKVFVVVRQVMGVPAHEVKALLNQPSFQVAAGWRSDLTPWCDKLQEAGATVEIR
jgi:hypothetical protein